MFEVEGGGSASLFCKTCHSYVCLDEYVQTIESCHCRYQDSLVYMRALLQGSMSDKLRATLEEEIADRERDLAVSFDLD